MTTRPEPAPTAQPVFPAGTADWEARDLLRIYNPARDKAVRELRATRTPMEA